MDKVQKLQQAYAEEDETLYNFVLQELLETVQGRKFLYRQLEKAGVGQQPFSTNALTMSFNCGRLNVGNEYLSDIMNVNPERYVHMLKEAQDERNTRDAQLAYARANPDSDD